MPEGGKRIPLDATFVNQRDAAGGMTAGDAWSQRQKRFGDFFESLMQAWFGPGIPPAQMSPTGTQARQFDYDVGLNIRYTPRSEEAVSFRQLRNIADADTMVRLAIETRKDQIEKCAWDIVGEDEDEDVSKDKRVIELKDFFKYPDKRRPWKAWLRMILEDLLVPDAATVYRRDARGGKPYAAELLAGDTIIPRIDETGRMPLDGIAYQQIIKGVIAAEFTREELLYCPRNPRTNRLYGFSPTEQLVTWVNIGLRHDLSTLEYYSSGNIPEALIGVPDNWNVDQIRQFQGYWDGLLEGQLGTRRKAKFIPGQIAKNYIPTKQPELKTEFDEWRARIVCYAFSLPAFAFTKQGSNRATAQIQQDTALEEGLLPIMEWLRSSIFDRIIQEWFGYEDLKFQWSQVKEPDALKKAQTDQIYIQLGVKSIDDTAAELGLDPPGMGPAIYTGQGATLVKNVVEQGDMQLEQAKTQLEQMKNPPDPYGYAGDGQGGPPQLPGPSGTSVGGGGDGGEMPPYFQQQQQPSSGFKPLSTGPKPFGKQFGFTPLKPYLEKFYEGHPGRPGQVGGSAPRGDAPAQPQQQQPQQRKPMNMASDSPPNPFSMAPNKYSAITPDEARDFHTALTALGNKMNAKPWEYLDLPAETLRLADEDDAYNNLISNAYARQGISTRGLAGFAKADQPKAGGWRKDLGGGAAAICLIRSTVQGGWSVTVGGQVGGHKFRRDYRFEDPKAAAQFAQQFRDDLDALVEEAASKTKGAKVADDAKSDDKSDDTKKGFPAHAGRPGIRGGSSPRGVAAGMAATERKLQAIAAQRLKAKGPVDIRPKLMAEGTPPYGFIRPNGEIAFGEGNRGHIGIANDLGFKSEQEAMEHGYVRYRHTRAGGTVLEMADQPGARGNAANFLAARPNPVSVTVAIGDRDGEQPSRLFRDKDEAIDHINSFGKVAEEDDGLMEKVFDDAEFVVAHIEAVQAGTAPPEVVSRYHAVMAILAK